MIPTDTTPEAERILIEGYRNMSPQRKLQRVFDLSDTLRQLARARIVAHSPRPLTEREIRLRVASLYIPRQLMIDAFGFDPEAEKP